MRRLSVVIGLAVLAAVFGWVMVASGLNKDNRTWVSAYKLITHLGIATALFGYLFWTWLRANQPETSDHLQVELKRLGWVITGVLFVQILFGGLMAGMRAGLIHPYLSVFVEGARFWHALGSSSAIGVEQVVDYEPYQSVKAIVQLLHRSTAWLLTGLVLLFVFKSRRKTISNHLLLGKNYSFVYFS